MNPIKWNGSSERPCKMHNLKFQTHPQIRYPDLEGANTTFILYLHFILFYLQIITYLFSQMLQSSP